MIIYNKINDSIRTESAQIQIEEKSYTISDKV